MKGTHVERTKRLSFIVPIFTTIFSVLVQSNSRPTRFSSAGFLMRCAHPYLVLFGHTHTLAAARSLLHTLSAPIWRSCNAATCWCANHGAHHHGCGTGTAKGDINIPLRTRIQATKYWRRAFAATGRGWRSRVGRLG
jgi:hypothetical protein